jgi:hypothetical protein
MIQESGARSYDEVIEFCRSVCCPLGRMLRLDLMRQVDLENAPFANLGYAQNKRSFDQGRM